MLAFCPFDPVRFSTVVDKEISQCLVAAVEFDGPRQRIAINLTVAQGIRGLAGFFDFASLGSLAFFLHLARNIVPPPFEAQMVARISSIFIAWGEGTVRVGLTSQR